MVGRINKIMAFILITVSIGTITPMKITNISVNAAVINNSEEISTKNNLNLASSDGSDLEIIEEAMIPFKLNGKYSSVSAKATISEFEECGALSYTLDDTAAENIAANLGTNMTQIISGVTQVKNYGNMLAHLGSPELQNKGTQLVQSATVVLAKLNLMTSLSEDQLVSMVKTEANNIPVYKYTAVDEKSTIAQGFAVGGILGLALNPVDTFNGLKKTASYNSIDLIPILPLDEGNTAYGKKIELNAASGVDVICDGLNINIIDCTNNKVYAINNPVYNMLQISAGTKNTNSKDILNVINFSDVSDLKGSTSNINLGSQGISTKILSLSLTTSDSKSKEYEYVLPIEIYEKNIIDDVIDNMNLSFGKDVLKGMVKSGTYIMIPNASSEIDNTVDGITNGLDNVSDALNNLSDALKDKNEDVDDAWDKVFDRFNNEPGWGRKDGYRYYYDKDGVSLKGVHKINGKVYYFNRIDGAMETGWQIVDGKRCYFDKKKGYELFNQWIQEEEDWYFVGEDGAVKKMEWIRDGGNKYYLKADGKMTRGWLKVEDYWYYFNKYGAMETSTWKWSNGKWYYLKDNGQAANDWLLLGSKWYCFKAISGEMQTGWFRANGNWYCTNDDGSMKTGWVYSKEGWCYLDESTGQMKKNEWVTVDGKKYYFNINGIVITGSRYIDGTKYVFNNDGILIE